MSGLAAGLPLGDSIRELVALVADESLDAAPHAAISTARAATVTHREAHLVMVTCRSPGRWQRETAHLTSLDA